MGQFFEFAMNHPLLVGATLIALVAAIGLEIRLRGQGGLSVAAGEAVRLINQGAAVVDVRDAANFAAGHIVDALNLSPADLRSRAEAQLKKKKPVLVVCDSGGESAKLAGVLRQAGFDGAWALAGGLTAWQRENLPVVATKKKA
ncbi:MAG: rhodanese-like domain-containing protein [Gammaproteobacteria bacterium]|nr:rhodanese-like domain-containing protein [Gammaproteobacteria bacterium]